jgi:hypothetical protein
LLLTQALAACGLVHEKREDKRTAGVEAAAAPAAAGNSDASASDPLDPETGGARFDASGHIEDAPVGAVSLQHSFRSFFYQSSDELKDLFATPGDGGTSMLCFPSALAYQTEYRRSHAEIAEAQLKSGAPDPAGDNAAGAAEVRFVADFCKADLKQGMTVPQGVACIDQLFAASDLKPDIHVIGQDAQWGAFGMFPSSTKAELRSVTPNDVRRLLNADASIIALVGAYVKDGAQMKRVKGHFVSLTGYDHSDGEPTNEATVALVDPSSDYGSRAGSIASDSFLMAPHADGLTSLLPEHADFELRGFSLGVDGATVVVESVVAFQ